jgi:hypothetical protein
MYVDARSERMRSGGCIYSWMPDSGDSTKLKDFYFLTFQSGEGLDLIIKVKQRPKGSLFGATSLFWKKGGRFELMPTTTTGFLQHLIWVSHLFTATRRQE